MSNMGYCRFENTFRDLRDCAEALGEMNDPESELSESEFSYFKSLIKKCRRLADDYEDFLS